MNEIILLGSNYKYFVINIGLFFLGFLMVLMGLLIAYFLFKKGYPEEYGMERTWEKLFHYFFEGFSVLSGGNTGVAEVISMVLILVGSMLSIIISMLLLGIL